MKQIKTYYIIGLILCSVSFSQDNVDIEKEDIVAHLLRKRLAIVALMDDTEYADSVGWQQVMKE